MTVLVVGIARVTAVVVVVGAEAGGDWPLRSQPPRISTPGQRRAQQPEQPGHRIAVWPELSSKNAIAHGTCIQSECRAIHDLTGLEADHLDAALM